MLAQGTLKARKNAGKALRSCIKFFAKNPYLTPKKGCILRTDRGKDNHLLSLNETLRKLGLTEDKEIEVRQIDIMGGGNSCGDASVKMKWKYDASKSAMSNCVLLQRAYNKNQYVSCDGSKHAKLKTMKNKTYYEIFDMVKLGNGTFAFYNPEHQRYLVAGDKTNNVRCNAKYSSLRRTNFLKVTPDSNVSAFSVHTKFLGLYTSKGNDLTHLVDHPEKFNIVPLK